MIFQGTDVKGKYLGAMVGSALGDAIGELAFLHPEKKELSLRVDAASELRYTDDTAMAIGLAQSLIKTGRLDPGELGDTFSRNFEREPWRGYASGPPTIFALVKKTGLSYTEAARRMFGGRGSLGNGAAMRIAPVGIFFHPSEDLYEMASLSAQVTHAHPVGMDGAAVQARAVATAVTLDPGEGLPAEAFMQGLVTFARTPQIRRKMERVLSLIREGAPPEAAAHVLGRGIAVQDSMPFAIYSFVKYPSSFGQCLFCAVLNGGDRDTLGAMACAVSGAFLGIEGIPYRWREKLENGAYIEELASALYRMS